MFSTFTRALAALALLTCAAQAQTFQPLDPLVRPRSGPGSLTFGFTVGYSPDFGTSGTDRYASHHLGLGLNGSYALTSDVTLFLRASTDTLLEQRIVSGQAEGRQTVALSTPTVGLTFVLPGPSAPHLDVEVTPGGHAEPWQLGISGTWSLLRDPLMVELSVGDTYSPSSGTHELLAGLGLAFAVNDSFTLRTQIAQHWTLGEIVIPSTDLLTGLSFNVDERNTLRSMVGVSRLGETLVWRIGIGYVFRS